MTGPADSHQCILCAYGEHETHKREEGSGIYYGVVTAHLLLEELGVGGALRGAQVEGPMRRVREPLQLIVLVALLGSLYGPLLLGGALVGRRGCLTPALAQELTLLAE